MADEEQAGTRRRWLPSWWPYLLSAVCVVIAIVSLRGRGREEEPDVEIAPTHLSAHPLGDADAAALGPLVGQLWRGDGAPAAARPARLGEPAQSVYVAFRAAGRRLADRWVHAADLPAGATVGDALAEALREGRAALGADADRVTRLEIDLAHGLRALDGRRHWRQIEDRDRQKVPRHRGVRGMRVQLGDRLHLWAPTEQIALNQSNRDLLEELRGRWGVTEEDLREGGVFHSFEADQILVRLDRDPVEAVVMFRGNRVVAPEEVDAASTEKLAAGMKGWLVNNVQPSGRLVYKRLPATGAEGSGNNQIRQWMASNALILWAKDRADAEVMALAERNIDYNLSKFYVQDGPLGRIHEGEKVKLGAVALAGMALFMHPAREKWAEKVRALRAMTEHLWKEDGSFRSFYAGGTEEFWNFYPGEALLFWATLYAEQPDPEILRRYEASFRFYRRWHLEPKNRNPAFVPWHLQANYALWKALGDEHAALKKELVEFSFETADWLVDLQQWDAASGVRHPDERGRFYTESRSFGVPHASSTGVYLEGLIDAHRLAKDVGDEARRERYRKSLVRALRSMMQLQLVDDVDLFYAADPGPIVGGLRTSEHDSEIRCDNVQHPLMGILKILRDFGPDDYGRAD